MLMCLSRQISSIEHRHWWDVNMKWFPIYLPGGNDGVCYRAASGNAGRFEWQGVSAVQGFPASNKLPQTLLRHPTEVAHNERPSGHGVFIGAALWRTVCGEDKQGFKEGEEDWSGAEVIRQQLRTQK